MDPTLAKRQRTKQRHVVVLNDPSPTSLCRAAVAACAGDSSIVGIVAEDDAAMMKLSRSLRSWRLLVIREQAEEPLKRRHAEFIVALHKILEHGSAIWREDVAEIQAIATLDPVAHPEIVPWQAELPEARASTQGLSTLLDAAAAVADDPHVVHPSLWAARPIDTFPQFMSALEPLFLAILIRTEGATAVPRNAFFTFAAATLSFVTGETVTFEAVRTHVTRDRPVEWSRRGWRKPFLDG